MGDVNDGRVQSDVRAEQAAKATAAQAASDDPRTVEDLKAKLRALNDQRGEDEQLPLSGSKAELAERLKAAQEG
jgi:hypothetical protein